MKAKAHHPDELNEEQQQRMCPSCRIRWNYPRPALRDMYNPVALEKRSITWLENAARVFDMTSSDCRRCKHGLHEGRCRADVEENIRCRCDRYEPMTGQLFTAEEFIAWLKPDLSGSKSHVNYEFDGSPKRNDATRHPDPLPYFPRRGAA